MKPAGEGIPGRPICRPGRIPIEPDGGIWRDQAACQGKDPNLFYPEHRGFWDASAALAICAECPVRDPCLEYALANNERHGVWGGVLDEERRALRKQRREQIA